MADPMMNPQPMAQQGQLLAGAQPVPAAGGATGQPPAAQGQQMTIGGRPPQEVAQALASAVKRGLISPDQYRLVAQRFGLPAMDAMAQQ